MPAGYDIIGDIHGHGGKLIDLLKALGYEQNKIKKCFRHHSGERKVIFLGDFIDRGTEHVLVLNTVMDMVNGGEAEAVMGNHEFNALAFHTPDGKDGYLRKHSKANINQHNTFLEEFPLGAEKTQNILKFFYTLPLWIERDGLRIIHASWNPDKIGYLEQVTNGTLRLTPEILHDACQKGHKTYEAIETLLKGVEVDLPSGVSFTDQDGTVRTRSRIKWWLPPTSTLHDAMLADDIPGLENTPLPPDVPGYPPSEPPCFVGHYWFTGDPEPLLPNLACTDYAVAKGGKLVAYRWEAGDTKLEAEKFFYV